MQAIRTDAGDKVASIAPKKFGVPMGAKIRARLLTNLDSRGLADGPVEAVLARPFVQRGEVVFPSHTMLYGRATTSSGRFIVSLNRLRLPDDTEVPFDGLAMDPEEGNTGLPASRHIAGAQAKQEGLAEKVAKSTAGAALGKAASDDVGQLAASAGQTVLGHQEGGMGAANAEALLLERGGDFDVFVKEAF